MLLTLIIIIICLGLIYIYLKLKYFTRYGPIPGLSPEFLLGNMRQTGLITRNESIPNINSELKSKFGDVYQFWMGPSRFIGICGVEDVQHIFTHRHIYDQGDVHIDKFGLLFHDALICTKGEKYKRHANLTLPLFRRNKIISNIDLINHCTDKILLDKWRNFDDNFVHLDIVDQSQKVLLLIFGFIGFDYDSDASNDLKLALNEFLNIFTTTLYMPEFVGKLYLKFNSKYDKSILIIKKYLDKIIEQEQNKTEESINSRQRASLIASLVHSLQLNEQIESNKSEEQKKGLTKNEILHEMLFFLVAGFETTSTALSWFIHLISKNIRIQNKIKEELNQYSKEYLTIEQLDSLIYLDAVIKEVLRFSPPSNGTVRTLTMDDRLPNSGFQLHRGEQVTIPFYNLARDQRYWKVDPNTFYPERFFNEDQDKNHHPYAFIPFGGGHRQCIGQDLARLELKTIAARLMQHVTFGDGGSELNKGGHLQQFTIVPKNVAVTISFD